MVGGKKIAVVAYLGNGDANTSYTKGLAIALKDAGSVVWGGYNTSAVCTARDGTVSNLLNDLKGIEYTNKLYSGECGHNDHAAAKSAKDFKYDEKSI